MLVTGGAGFIGSHVAEALLRRGDTVTVLDNFDEAYAPALKRANVAALERAGNVVLAEGDVCDAAFLDRVFTAGQVDVVVHLAARAGVRPSLRDPALYVRMNLGGTTELLKACERHGVRRCVLASSSSVYGNSAQPPFREDDPADQPESPYAATKRACEHMAASFVHSAGMQVTALRFFTVYGPRQRPEMAIRLFATALLDGREITLFGDGSMQRDFTFISDITRGVLAAVDKPVSWQVLNLGGHQTTSLNQLVAMLGEALQVTPRVRFAPVPPGDVQRTLADCTRAREALGWKAEVSLVEGLALFARWMKAGAVP